MPRHTGRILRVAVYPSQQGRRILGDVRARTGAARPAAKARRRSDRERMRRRTWQCSAAHSHGVFQAVRATPSPSPWGSSGGVAPARFLCAARPLRPRPSGAGRGEWNVQTLARSRGRRGRLCGTSIAAASLLVLVVKEQTRRRVRGFYITTWPPSFVRERPVPHRRLRLIVLELEAA